MIKHGEYTTKDGEVKANWKQVGIIKSNDKGDFILLDPTVNLAGFDRQGKDMLFANIFEDSKKGNTSNQKTQAKSQEPDDDDVYF